MKLPQPGSYAINLETKMKAQDLADIRKRPVGVIISTSGMAYDEEFRPEWSSRYIYVAYPSGQTPAITKMSVIRRGIDQRRKYHVIVQRADESTHDLGGTSDHHEAVRTAEDLARRENYTQTIKIEELPL
jgi:hypothetical protein